MLVIVAFGIAVLVRTFFLQAFHIPSGSMEDTLLVGDRVLVNKLVYDLRGPHRGEVVVFRGPSNWVPEARATGDEDGFLASLGRNAANLVGISTPGEKDFIKRIIGLPGDTVECCNAEGRVTINGVPLEEPYVREDSPVGTPGGVMQRGGRKFGPIKVGEGQLFVMGDHRAISLDSRYQGQIPIDNVIGRAFAIAFPASRWGSLPVPATFDRIARPNAAGRPPSGSLPGSLMSTPAVALPSMLSAFLADQRRNMPPIRTRRLRL